jgi:hypothetical protein
VKQPVIKGMWSRCRVNRMSSVRSTCVRTVLQQACQPTGNMQCLEAVSHLPRCFVLWASHCAGAGVVQTVCCRCDISAILKAASRVDVVKCMWVPAAPQHGTSPRYLTTIEARKHLSRI